VLKLREIECSEKSWLGSVYLIAGNRDGSSFLQVSRTETTKIRLVLRGLAGELVRLRVAHEI